MLSQVLNRTKNAASFDTKTGRKREKEKEKKRF